MGLFIKQILIFWGIIFGLFWGGSDNGWAGPSSFAHQDSQFIWVLNKQTLQIECHQVTGPDQIFIAKVPKENESQCHKSFWKFQQKDENKKSLLTSIDEILDCQSDPRQKNRIINSFIIQNLSLSSYSLLDSIKKKFPSNFSFIQKIFQKIKSEAEAVPMKINGEQLQEQLKILYHALTIEDLPNLVFQTGDDLSVDGYLAERRGYIRLPVSMDNGGQKIIFLGMDIETEETVVITKMIKAPGTYENLKHEGAILQLLKEKKLQLPENHSLHDHFPFLNIRGMIDTGEAVDFVEDYYRLGNLNDWVRGANQHFTYHNQYHHRHNSSEQIASMAMDLAKGLHFLHQNKIIHRDLKPQNILLSMSHGKPRLHISDFGFAYQATDPLRRELGRRFVGTHFILSPFYVKKFHLTDPLILSEEERERINFKNDLWSLGINLFYMIKESYPKFVLQKVMNDQEKAFAHFAQLPQEEIDKEIAGLPSKYASLKPILGHLLNVDDRHPYTLDDMILDLQNIH